jgi:hypothetical protein
MNDVALVSSPQFQRISDRTSQRHSGARGGDRAIKRDKLRVHLPSQAVQPSAASYDHDDLLSLVGLSFDHASLYAQGVPAGDAVWRMPLHGCIYLLTKRFSAQVWPLVWTLASGPMRV